MLVYYGGILTRCRLAAARGVVWFGWELIRAGTRMFLCKQHPVRVHVEGAYHRTRPTHLAAMRFATAPRFHPLTGWRIVATAVAAIALAALAIPGETRIIHGAVDTMVGVLKS